MTYLLDTHVMLWALTEPTRLGRTARDVIENRSSRLVVSAVSAWEITTKHRLGKLPQADVLLGAYAKHLDRLGAPMPHGNRGMAEIRSLAAAATGDREGPGGWASFRGHSFRGDQESGNEGNPQPGGRGHGKSRIGDRES